MSEAERHASSNGEWATRLPTDCPKCEMHVWSEPLLGEAIPSVAIAQGIDSYEVLRRYLVGFHAGGHRADEVGKISDGGGGGGAG